jgi:hypothetical protein
MSVGLANAIILAVWLWWLPSFSTLTARRSCSLHGAQDIAPWRAVTLWRAYVYWDWQGGPTLEAMLIAGGLFGAWVAVRRGSVVGLLLAAAAFGIPALEIGLSWVVKPVFVERTIIWLEPFYLLLATIGMMRLPHALRIASLTLVLAMQVLGTVTYFRTEHNTPWSRLVAQLRAGLCPGDLLLVAPGYLQLPLDYETRNDPPAMKVFDIGVSSGNALMPGVTVDATFAGLRTAIATTPPIWVVADRRYIGPWF